MNRNIRKRREMKGRKRGDPGGEGDRWKNRWRGNGWIPEPLYTRR